MNNFVLQGRRGYRRVPTNCEYDWECLNLVWASAGKFCNYHRKINTDEQNRKWKEMNPEKDKQSKLKSYLEHRKDCLMCKTKIQLDATYCRKHSNKYIPRGFVLSFN